MFEWKSWYHDNTPLLLLVTLAYYPVTLVGWYLCKDRQAVQYPKILGLWNLSLFSANAYCLYNLGKVLLSSQDRCHLREANHSFSEVNSLGFFCFLKILEMGDTAWLVLRKRNLSLLHLWHHWSVFLFCWNMMYRWNQGIYLTEGISFGFINAFIHFLMYLYYAVTSVSSFRNRLVAQTLTTLQILQFVLGIGIMSYVSAYCGRGTRDLVFGWIIYVSYLALFGRYYMKRYLKKVKPE